MFPSLSHVPFPVRSSRSLMSLSLMRFPSHVPSQLLLLLPLLLLPLLLPLSAMLDMLDMLLLPLLLLMLDTLSLLPLLLLLPPLWPKHNIKNQNYQHMAATNTFAIQKMKHLAVQSKATFYLFNVQTLSVQKAHFL